MIGQLPNAWWVFVLLGICAGVLSGTLGLGSGIILIPALVLFFSFEQKNAQGMALAVMVPMALVGALRYWKNPEIEMNAVVIGLIICGALAGAFLGAELAGRLPSHILRKIFAIVLVIAAVWSVYLLPVVFGERKESISSTEEFDRWSHSMAYVQKHTAADLAANHRDLIQRRRRRTLATLVGLAGLSLFGAWYLNSLPLLLSGLFFGLSGRSGESGYPVCPAHIGVFYNFQGDQGSLRGF